MVTQQGVDTVAGCIAAAAECCRSIGSGIVACGRAGLVLVDTGDVDRGHTAGCADDPIAVRVIDESRQHSRSLLYLHQPILTVEDLGVRCAANRTGRLVSVGIIAIAVAVCGSYCVRLGCAVGVAAARHVGDVAPSAGSGQAAS